MSEIIEGDMFYSSSQNYTASFSHDVHLVRKYSFSEFELKYGDKPKERYWFHLRGSSLEHLETIIATNNKYKKYRNGFLKKTFPEEFL